jgi:hypothetical protein
MIPTIELATKIHASLCALTWPTGWSVYARGVPTQPDGTPDAQAVQCQRNYPFADIIVGERVPGGHGSVLRAYGLIIRVVTWQPDDQFQSNLYAGADVLANWICSRPQLSPSSVVVDSVYFDTLPTMANFGEDSFGQYVEWTATINTRTVATP